LTAFVGFWQTFCYRLTIYCSPNRRGATTSQAALPTAFDHVTDVLDAMQRGVEVHVRSACAAGVSVDAVRGKGGRTLLTRAVELNHVPAAALLLQHGADPMAPAHPFCPLVLSVVQCKVRVLPGNVST
jgi:hypothetical protein